MVAGGMENMSKAPYLLDKARGGYRMGHGQVLDHMFIDGLQDAYEGHLMGHYADETAKELTISRAEQDEFALTSLDYAKSAIENGAFKEEITPVTVKTRKKETEFIQDENPFAAKPEKIPELRPAFNKDGTVTAANASSISDGAAALVLMRRSEAERRGLQPLAQIVSSASYAREPQKFTQAPIGAMEKACAAAGWQMTDIDLFEINEAFAVVSLAAIKHFSLSRDKVNIHGGACALGHPIGASGARILATLYYALRATDRRRGMASLCIGGGEAVAVTIETLPLK